MQGQTNNLGRGPLGVPTNSPVSDPGTSARIQNRPNVPIGTAPPHHGGGKPTARLGGNKEQGTERFPLLKLGTRGNDVRRLQRLLNLHRDKEDQLKVDGNFGPKTRDAVVEFQKDEGLKRDGVVGRDTWFSLISVGTQEASWKAKPPAAPTKVVAASTITATKKTVDQWTLSERFEYVLTHCGPYLGPDMRAQFTALLTPVNLGIMVGSLVVWAAGHFFGMSEIADAFLLGFGLVFLGKAAIDAARLLKNVIEITCSASTEAELEDAAKDLAEAISIIGVVAFFALLAKVGRAIGNKLKAAKAAEKGGGARGDSESAAGETQKAESKPATPKDPLAAQLEGSEFNRVKADRVRPGSNGKVAVIGRSMGRAVGPYADGLNKAGYDVETFSGDKISPAAQAEWESLKDAYAPNPIPESVLPKTEMFQENQAWAQKLADQGYTVVDVDNPGGQGPSPFYEMEKTTLFGH